ncbi:MAG: hypothetical protein WCG27_08035, partial [Pseudomonadota bacterium]
MTKHLTKHDYINYKRCPRLFAYNWASYQVGDAEANPIKDFLIAQGKEVGLLAQELFRECNGISVEKEFYYGDLAIRADVFNAQS